MLPEKRPSDYQPLGVEIMRKRFIELIRRINAVQGQRFEMTVEEVALGFSKLATSICLADSALTDTLGFHTTSHNLASFDGAGGRKSFLYNSCLTNITNIQIGHDCDIAASLGISRVIIHQYSSILSAYGTALADVVEERPEPLSRIFEQSTKPHFIERLAASI